MNKFRSIAATILEGALICIVLTACENFLKSQEVKEQILDTIAYNNAPECKVLLKADPAMGEFLSNGEQTFKVGYASEIQFSVVKSAYCFTGFEAVSKLDQNVSLNEYVSFENPVNDDEKGIYKIKVKILKKSDDICIRPVCLELPCVTEYSPALGQNAANVQLRISFNMPMDQEALTFGSGNIIISSGTTNLNYLFNEPVLSSDSKTLTITPKASQLYDYITESNITVTVELLESITVTRTVNEKQYVLALKKDENTKFSVIYKKEKETKPPVQHEFFVTQMLNSPASASMQDIKNAAQNVSDFAKYSMKTLSEPLDYYKNSSDGSFYIYGRFYDDSGIAFVEVTEKRTHNKNGQDVTEAPQTSQYYSSSQNTWFFTEDGYTDFIIKHTLKNEDGEYNITVSVTDSCQNPTIIPDFTAIKSLVEIKDEDINLYNITLEDKDLSQDFYILQKNTDGGLSHKCINSTAYNEQISKIKLNKISYSFYKTLDIQDLFKVECSYENNQNKSMTYNKTKERYEYDLEAENFGDLKISLDVYIKRPDETYTLLCNKDFYFPPDPVPLNNNSDLYYNNSDYQINHVAYLESGKKIDSVYKFLAYNKDTIQLMEDVFNLFSFVPDYCSTIIPIRIPTTYHEYENSPKKGYLLYKNGNLFSKLKEFTNIPISNYDFEYRSSQINYIFKIEIEKSPCDIPGYLNITLTPSFYERYDDNVKKDSFLVYSIDNGYCYDYKEIYGPEKDSVTFKMPISKMKTSNSFNIFIISKSEHKMYGTRNVSLAKLDVTNQEDLNLIKNLDAEINPKGFIKSVSSSGDLTSRLNPILNYFFNKLDLNDNEIMFCPGTIKHPFLDISGNIYISINNSDEYCLSTEKCLKDDDLFLPSFEMDKTENTVSIRYVGNDQVTASTTFKWRQEDFVSYRKTDFSKKNNKVTCNFTYIPSEYAKILAYNSYLDYFDPSSKEWTNYSYTPDESDQIIDLALEENKKMENKFIKASEIFIPIDGNYSFYTPEAYYYTGTPSSGSQTDKLIKNGDLYLIASDQPVLMQTYITTTNSYNDCKNWSLEQWQKNHRRIDEMVLNFTPETCHTLQYYSPDTSKLRENTCYVIVARYADGHTQMREVMQK